MTDVNTKIPEELVTSINMNGLRGRMLRVPAAKKSKREFLFVYGHHASLERVYGFAETLSDYGAVTISDLPGFGGMDSFYTIGERPTLDNFASYLASFVKMRYRNRRLTIVGFSFGFVIVTRMLQLYPELRPRIDLVVSIAGFAHKDDFVFSKNRRRFYRLGSQFFSLRVPAFFFRSTALHPSIIRMFYKRTHNAQEKFEGLEPEFAKAMTEFEVHLWRCNELRTYMATSHTFFTVDNTVPKVPMNIWHVSVENDKYFVNGRVIGHLEETFSGVTVVEAVSKKHSPSIIADKATAGVFFPPRLRKMFRSK